MENIWTEDAFERLHGLLDRIGEAKKVLQTSKEKKKKNLFELFIVISLLNIRFE